MSQASGDSRDEHYVLAVDLGSTALKVGLVSLTGRIAWWNKSPLKTDYGPGGAATQDAEEWWKLVVAASRRGIAEATVEPDRVVAVGVTGQWASTVPVDAEGHPVAPCVMWMDRRGEAHARALVGGWVDGHNVVKAASWLRRSGGIPDLAGSDPVGHMLYLSRDEPAIARAARWYLEPVDYLSMRFTGQATASPASMTGAWLTDNRRLDVLAYDRRLVNLAEIDPSKLAPLVATGSVVGEVQPSVASELGISPRTRVITGLPDLHAATVGSGSLRLHDAFLSISTTGWIGCTLPKKKTDIFRHMATVPGLSTEHYVLANNQEAAGRCLEWFGKQVAGQLARGERWTYDELTSLAAAAPPGAGGVIFAPWLLGERSPVDDRRARGGFHNVSLSTSAADLARSVLEGVAFNSRWLLTGAERMAGQRLEPLRLVGGGAQSDLWCQIIADVFDRRIERVLDPLLTGLRGCALSAGMALGEVSHEEVRDLVPVDKVFTPDPENRAVYDRLSTELPKLYKAQRKIFHRLNKRSDG